MSLYNALFGVNALAPILARILDLEAAGWEGKWSPGRFRDIFLNEDGTEIHLYTRNGGGNRDQMEAKRRGGSKDENNGRVLRKV